MSAKQITTKVILNAWNTDMVKATITHWHKNIGEIVKKNEPLLEVESAKINFTVIAPCNGFLKEQNHQIGELISVGDTLGIISKTKVLTNQQEANRRPRPTTSQRSTNSLQISNELSGLRKTIATNMMHSLTSMAQITLMTEADLTDMELYQKNLNTKYPKARIRSLHLIIKAAAKALELHPDLNGTYENSRLTLSTDINVGVAVSIDKGLIVPVIQNANLKSVTSIAEELFVLSKKARDGTIDYQDVTNGTFTVSSLASYDIDAFTPIINPPELAILGIGRSIKRPLVVNEEIAIRTVASLSITFDHQVVDGAPAASFLKTVKTNLTDLEWMAA